ncbi:hypothetical protein D3C75_719450 [compost metagenome]
MDDHAAAQIDAPLKGLQAFVIGTHHIRGLFKRTADADADAHLQELQNLGFDQIAETIIVRP